MEFTQQPCGCAPAGGPLIYRLEGCDPGQPVTVQMSNADSEQLLGLKRLAGAESYLLDISAYTASLPVVKPFAGGAGIALQTMDRRTVAVTVSAGDTIADTILVAGGSRYVLSGELLSLGPAVRDIEHAGHDELAVLATEEGLSARYVLSGTAGSLELPGGTVAGEGRMAALPVNVATLLEMAAGQGVDPAGLDRLEATIFEGGREVAARRYRITDDDPLAVHIAWVNAFGAVDHYAFWITGEKTVAARSEGVGQDGTRRTYAVRAEVITQALSRIEPREVLEWLAGILCAPRVWMITENGAEQVHVTSTEAATLQQGPGRMELSFSRREGGTL